MSKNIFVGSLAWGTTSEGIEQAFAQYGVVTSAKVISDRETGRSKGFAFVEMGSVEEAKAAAAALNDKDFQGRQMLVTGAKSEGRGGDGERPQRTGEGRSGEGRSSEGRSSEGRGRNERGGRGEKSGRGGDRDLIEKPTRQVKALDIEVVSSPSLNVTNLNAEASEIDLTDLFAGIGTIQHREDTSSAEGAVTKNLRVDLADTGEAQKAVELLDGKSFMGHQIRVSGVKSEA